MNFLASYIFRSLTWMPHEVATSMSVQDYLKVFHE